MTTILGISGSLREGSFNAGLLRAASELAPGKVQVEVAGIHGIPLYDADLEAREGIPDSVSALKERIANADGLLLVTPEYNNSIPGVFKNAIDWLSRPPEDQARVFGGRRTGLMGATPGSFGTAFSQRAWLPVLRLLKTRLWQDRMLWISGATGLFDAEGNLTDDNTKSQVKKYMAGFADFVGGAL
jgi:NAD(P)H-dependent FMN reductase